MTERPPHDGRVWFGLDQGLSSATNFAGAALTAGLLSELGYGGWAIGYAVFLAVLTTVRTVAGDVAMIVLPGADGPSATTHFSGSASTALLCSVATGALLVAGSFSVGGATRSALVALGVCLPGLILQDSLRFSLLAVGRARAACFNDGCWLVLSVAALMLLRRTDTASVPLAMLAWAGAATPSAALGLWQLKTRLAFRSVRSWFRSTHSLSTRLLGSHFCYLAASMTMVSVIVGLAQGAEPVGAIRASQTLFGPVTVLFAGASLYTQPHMVRRLASGFSIRRPAVQLTAVGIAMTAICAATLWWIPETIGVRIFGNSWSNAHDLIPEMACIMVAGALAAGAIANLRAIQSVSWVLRVNLATAFIQIPATWWMAQHASLTKVLMTHAVLSAAAAGTLWALAVRQSPECRSENVMEP